MALSSAVKQKCPYMEKCYRKNPIHFNEMSHPHLEKLLIDQLDGAIQIPTELDFECSDRSQLLDQLRVLQMVLQKERDKGGDGFIALTKIGSSMKTGNKATDSSSDKNTIQDGLKDKVERHKKATALRRENKLKQLDGAAEALSEPSTSTESSEMDTSRVSKIRVKLDDLNIKEDQEENSSQGKKRSGEFSNEDASAKKTKTSIANNKDAKGNISGRGAGDEKSMSKMKQEDTSRRQGSTSTQSSTESDGSVSSLGGSSIMDAYTSCKTDKSRAEMRKKAIEMMRRQGFEVSVVEPGEFALKYALSAPYHMFLTRIEKSKPTYDQRYSITFPEILDRSLGEIVASLQINFMVDLGWLCLQYLLAGQSTDMLILYGDRVDEEKQPPNIKMHLVTLPTKFGCHHSKVMVLRYKDDGIRVVVSTANLYSDDWENRTQGLWISPHLPLLPESAKPSDGESPTMFKRDFERYLNKYRLPILSEWIWAVRRADFSSVNVFFVASVPGSHKDTEIDLWGHRKLAAILSKHATLPPDAPQWPIVAQSSSIGSLGPNDNSWLFKEIVPCMSRETTSGLKSHPSFQFIYPSIRNYKQSFDCRNGSCCLPYSLMTHSKQQWFETYMYQWKATQTARDKAMPHIKSYTRISPDLKKIPWFVLTSANLSKAAWGSSRVSHYIMSYEAGVVFIPKFIVGGTTFPIKEEESPDVPVFPIPYDLPLVRYQSEDKPFVSEFFQGYE